MQLQEDILQGEEVARCPSCSLIIRVIYSPEDFVVEEEETQEDEKEEKEPESSEVTVA